MSRGSRVRFSWEATIAETAWRKTGCRTSPNNARPLHACDVSVSEAPEGLTLRCKSIWCYATVGDVSGLKRSAWLAHLHFEAKRLSATLSSHLVVSSRRLVFDLPAIIRG